MVVGAVRTAALALVLLGALAARADFEAGQRAWDAGRPGEALAQWQAAAGSGDRRAMLALGRLYLQGLGVLQDYVEAHKWLNLAASRGEAAAVAERDALAERMTPAQVAEAQSLAQAWRPGEGQGAVATEETTAAPPTHAEPTPSRTRISARTANTDSSQTPQAIPSAATSGAHADSTATPAPASDAGPPPPRAIREAQTLLAALGYAPGAADGIWGARTGAAYRAFLDDAGLTAADALTPEALRALRAAAKRRGGSTKSAGAAGSAATRSTPARPRPAVRPDALHRAAKAGDIDGLKAALAAGADVNARDGKGRTALMHAANKGYPLMVPLLLAAEGADADIRAADGATALFMAVVHGHAEVVEQLLKGGADIFIKGPTSKTPMDIAKLREDAAIMTLLEVAGRDDTVFAQAKSSGSWKFYLQTYPHGRHADEARRMQAEEEREARRRQAEKERNVDDAAYAKARSEGTGAAYAAYLKSHPKGRHADDAAFARARWVDTGPAYAAYLKLHPQGKHAADARSKSASAGSDLHPKCSEMPGEYLQENHAECWEEVSTLPGCFRWNDHHHSDRLTEHWSGGCSGGIADGSGTLSMSSGSDHLAFEATGTYVKGKAHGHWTGRESDGSVWEGRYVNHKQHGHWEYRDGDGVWKGPYVDGKLHGDWAWRAADGSVFEGLYVDGSRHGRWVERLADGRVGGGAFVDGKQHGTWVINHDDDAVSRGTYVDGKKHGRWTEPLPWSEGSVGEGSYVDGKRHGQWVERYEGAVGQGMIGQGPYVEDSRHGRWFWRNSYGKGSTSEGYYAEGDKDGRWIVRRRDGTCSVERYKEGEFVGSTICR